MATSCWPENKERVVKELVQGQEYAYHLQLLLKKSHGVEAFLISYDDLVLKILASFTQALSLLSASENLATSQVDSVCCDNRRSEDFGESRKRSLITTKDKRGCHKRKKTSQSWTKISPTIEDAHAWRKYGQKEILNAKYPRSYFRCTHKYDQGCKATKQVQIQEEDPQMYLITYIGLHTCRDFLKVPQIISTDSDPYWESYRFSSCSNDIPAQLHRHHHQFSSSGSPSNKEETPSDLSDNLSSLDSAIWTDFAAFHQTVDEPAIASSTRDQGISQSLDMELVLKSIDFNFDESEFNYLS